AQSPGETPWVRVPCPGVKQVSIRPQLNRRGKHGAERSRHSWHGSFNPPPAQSPGETALRRLAEGLRLRFNPPPPQPPRETASVANGKLTSTCKASIAKPLRSQRDPRDVCRPSSPTPLATKAFTSIANLPARTPALEVRDRVD